MISGSCLTRLRYSKYPNRLVKLGKVMVMCEQCIHTLSKGRSRGKYRLIGVSSQPCQICSREVIKWTGSA